MKKKYYEIFAVEKFENIGKYESPIWTPADDILCANMTVVQDRINTILKSYPDKEFIEADHSLTYTAKDRSVMIIAHIVNVYTS